MLVIVAALIVGGCSGSKIPVSTFDPSTPCTTDGRQPGAYPDLEAALPKTYEGQAPVSVDSGRNCTDERARDARRPWHRGRSVRRRDVGPRRHDGADGRAVFEADGLTASEMLTFYRDGATQNSKTEKLATSELTVGGAAAQRLDVLQSDGTGQTVVTWPATEPGRVNVLLAADLGDAKVLEALAVFGAR